MFISKVQVALEQRRTSRKAAEERYARRFDFNRIFDACREHHQKEHREISARMMEGIYGRRHIDRRRKMEVVLRQMKDSKFAAKRRNSKQADVEPQPRLNKWLRQRPWRVGPEVIL